MLSKQPMAMFASNKIIELLTFEGLNIAQNKNMLFIIIKA